MPTSDPVKMPVQEPIGSIASPIMTGKLPLNQGRGGGGRDSKQHFDEVKPKEHFGVINSKSTSRFGSVLNKVQVNSQGIIKSAEEALKNIQGDSSKETFGDTTASTCNIGIILTMFSIFALAIIMLIVYLFKSKTI